MADNENIASSDADRQFHRFLYLGTETNVWNANGSNLSLLSIPDITKLMEEGHISPLVVKRFHKESWFIDVDSLYFILAAASKSSKALGKSYLVAEEVCRSSNGFLSFVHFKAKNSSGKGGWGHALRRFASKWYLERDAKELAMEVTKVMRVNRWSHKDVLCLAHVKASKPDTACVLKFIVKGLETAEREYGVVPEAEEVLKYLKAAHELKHTTDHHAAARLIEIHNFSFEHIPNKLMKSKEIWTCLIPRLKLSKLLNKLHYLHKIGLLKPNSVLLKAFLERMSDENALSDGDIGPFEAFLMIRQWEKANRPMPGKPLLRQNVPQINDALLNLHMTSYKVVPSTGKRYIVAVDVRNTMVNSRTVGCSCISPADATAVVLLALAKAEASNLTTLAFSTSELVAFDVKNTMSLSDIAQHMRNIPMGPVNLSAPIQWALDTDKAFDVFIVLTDNQTTIGEVHPANLLKEYRTKFNLPNTRFITCALGSSDFSVASSDDANMLDIAGFHVKLLQVIQDYARCVF